MRTRRDGDPADEATCLLWDRCGNVVMIVGGRSLSRAGKVVRSGAGIRCNTAKEVVDSQSVW